MFHLGLWTLGHFPSVPPRIGVLPQSVSPHLSLLTIHEFDRIVLLGSEITDITRKSKYQFEFVTGFTIVECRNLQNLYPIATAGGQTTYCTHLIKTKAKSAHIFNKEGLLICQRKSIIVGSCKVATTIAYSYYLCTTCDNEYVVLGRCTLRIL